MFNLYGFADKDCIGSRKFGLNRNAELDTEASK
jgi:hypothetical protein